MSNYIASLSDTSIDKLIDGYYTTLLSPPDAARLNGNKKKIRELNWWKMHWMLQKMR